VTSAGGGPALKRESNTLLKFFLCFSLSRGDCKPLKDHDQIARDRMEVGVDIDVALGTTTLEPGQQ